jgi:hypothetical protein
MRRPASRLRDGRRRPQPTILHNGTMDPGQLHDNEDDLVLATVFGTLVSAAVGIDRIAIVVRTADGFTRLATGVFDTASRQVMATAFETLIGHRVSLDTVQGRGVIYTPPVVHTMSDLGPDGEYDPAAPEYQAPAVRDPEPDAPAEVVGELVGVEYDEPSSRWLALIGTERGIQRVWTRPTNGPAGDNIRGLAAGMRLMVGNRVRITTGGQPPTIESFGLAK